MYAAPSESSQVSHLSQQILDNVSKKSETKYSISPKNFAKFSSGFSKWKRTLTIL